MCGAWPVGADTDTSGNTLGCRLYHANAALSLGLDHCNHAGPSGVDVASGNPICGTQCDAYCSIMLLKPGCNDTIRAFNSLAECQAVCPLFKSNAPLYFDNTTGDNLQCRIYHAKAAFAIDLTTHCQHAAPLGGGQCGTLVDNYCLIVQGLCTGTNAQYNALPYCLAVAKNFPNATNYDYTGDSIACRAYHAVVGGASSSHCAHGGASGNGSSGCGGDICSTFCQLSGKICPSNYASAATCKTACTAWITKIGGALDTSGDTYGCRLYHLGAAATDPTTHCPHAVASSATCGGAAPGPNPTPGGSGAILGFSVLALMIANLF